MKISIFPLVIIFPLIVAGCTSQKPTETTTNTLVQQLSELCIQACNNVLAAGQPLEEGPCLLNPIREDRIWVCDVAHNPRQPIDDLPENQCSAYISGEANHFVEVTPDCKFIRAK
ncbi:MAG: hypothetical protein HY362_03230 [Candidatus Aenigmarchaeota archaeon]|nr:hypothetical protein [Candidatus Aenigmarchaeota archaeon]